MDIIIAGAGKVGFNLAKNLSGAHSVTVIDQNIEALHRLQESLDILIIHGDIEDPLTYQKLVDKDVDLFVAVTNLDEANLISTIIADDTLKIKRKIIRLKNEFFAKSTIKDKIGIDDTIFPLDLTSKTITTLLRYPKANNVKSFQYTNLKLISVSASSQLEPLQIDSQYFKIVGIERDKKFFIPDSNVIIYPKDLVFIFGDEKYIQEFCPKLEIQAPMNITRCVIFGAGDLGISICRTLIENNIEVKLIDKDINLCAKAEEKLGGKAMVINSKYSNKSLFKEEGLEHAQMAIVATGNDEYNIIKSMEAIEHGIKKVVAINNETEYYNLMHSLGVVVVRGPKTNAYNAIIEKIYSHKTISKRIYSGGSAIVFMQKIVPTSKSLGSTITIPKALKNSIIYLIRNEKLLPLDETTILLDQDIVTIFCLQTQTQQAQAWINGF